MKFHALVLAVACSSCASLDVRDHKPTSSPSAPISTDRPGFLYATSVVPEGAIQLELGTPTYVRSSRDDSITTFNIQGRYGLNEWSELRVAATPLAFARSQLDGSSHTESGSGDVEVGFKLAHTGQPAALIASVRLPTGEHPFTSDDPAYSLAAVAETPLDSAHSVKGLLGWSRTPVGGGDELDSAAVGALLSRTWTSEISSYVELASFPALEHGPDPAYAGGGCAYLLGADAQFDIALDVGLNDDAEDVIFTLGVSIRR